jgi:DNA-directed RNA polymerase specialized sigma24 family protein
MEENMSLGVSIAPHLPYLRRYARALNGDQPSGDQYVAATLEALVADPSTFDRSCDTRIALFKAFSQIWNAAPWNAYVAPPASTSAERRIESLTPMARQAFLLTAVEEFSIGETAKILEVDDKVVEKMLDDAGHEIGEQLSTSVLIIEDEPLISMDLQNLIEELGHCVVGKARTRSEAVAEARRLKPGMVLADIQLADGSSGLDAVRDILGSFSIPVIFITAFPESLLTGERPEPTFLISKPYRRDLVRAVISQALFFEVSAHLGKRPAA